MRPYLGKLELLDLWFGKCFSPSWPKAGSWSAYSLVEVYFKIWGINWIHLLILDKMRSCLGKLELGFWTGRLLIVKSFGPDWSKILIPTAERGAHYDFYFDFCPVIHFGYIVKQELKKKFIWKMLWNWLFHEVK